MGNQWQPTQPSKVANLLPGWITYDGNDYRLDFADRFDFCNHCKNRTSFETRYRYVDCTARLCGYCQDAGHILKYCPSFKADNATKTSTKNDMAKAESEFR
jgi:hypothetical protein